jgi:hypothetical protein
VPLTYQYRAVVPAQGDASCSPQCDANVTVNSVWGTFQGGGGEGLHYVVEGGLGYTWFRDFENDDTGAAISGAETDKDFSFFLGTGFGYGLTRRLSINVVQDWAFVRHQGEGLSNSERTTTQQRTTRLGVRYGFGNRRPGI